MFERAHAVHPRQLDVHQHQLRLLLAGESDTVLGVRGLDGGEAVVLQEIARELHVLVVVLHQQDQIAQPFTSTGRRMGSVNENVLPLPGVLSSEIRPPCSSTKRFVRVSPSPVPSRERSRPTCRNSSNTPAWSSGAIPMPLSLTSMRTSPSSRVTLISTRPPSGVNFAALDRRL